MARMINMKAEAIVKAVVQTLFEDGSITERSFAVGDVVENLRYNLDGEVAIVSGKVKALNYSLPTRVTFNASKPEDTFSTDVTLVSVVLDCSTQYESNIVTVPMIEILEDEDAENVQRINFFASLQYKLRLYFSNYTVQETVLEVGDTVDNVKVMLDKPGNDVTGVFTIVAFGYTRRSASAFTINSIVLKNDEHGTIVAPLDHILSLTELITYTPVDIEATIQSVNDARDGEIVKLAQDVDATEQAVVVTGKEITMDLNGKTLQAGNTANNGITVSNGGKLTLKNGKVVSDQPYSSATGATSTVISVRDGGELTIGDNFEFTAVQEDNPTDNGTFGVGVYGDGKLTINGGKLEAGWYAVTTNGSKTTEDCVITINGGEFISVADYALYKPDKGLLVINDGYVSGAAGALAANAGRIAIHGGRFNSLGTGDTGEWSDGTGGLGNAVLNLNGRYGEVRCLIDGGYFDAGGGVPILVSGSTYPVAVKIRGGFFSEKPDESYLDNGFVFSEEKNAEGYWEVHATAFAQPLGEWP